MKKTILFLLFFIAPIFCEARTINTIIIHHSASPDVSMETIKSWHQQRGLKTIGYHFVIRANGSIENGRSVLQIGAHAKNRNAHSIGICLTGYNKFTDAQIVALKRLLEELTYNRTHAIKIERHSATCPGIGLNVEKIVYEVITEDQIAFLEDVKSGICNSDSVEEAQDILDNLGPRYCNLWRKYGLSDTVTSPEDVRRLVIKVYNLSIRLKHSYGKASYYRDFKTASGDNMYLHPFAKTAASWFYPLGTKLRVRCCDTNKEVTVLVNDRGPNKSFVQKGRIIDLSPAAFKALAPLKIGLINVTVEEIEKKK